MTFNNYNFSDRTELYFYRESVLIHLLLYVQGLSSPMIVVLLVALASFTISLAWIAFYYRETLRSLPSCRSLFW